MMNRIFGRNDQVEEMIGGLETRIDEQNRSLIATGTAVIELEIVIENMRKYNEAMEVRLRKQSERMIEVVKEEFEKGFDTAVQSIKETVVSLGKAAQPKEIVKAIDTKAKEERKIRQFNIVRTRLEKAMAKYLVGDIPLCKESSRYKNIEITPQGLAIYEATSEFITNIAKVSGKNKEKFTNYGVYRRFFRTYGINPYKRATVRKSDGTNMSTLLAAVIVNGHIQQYIEFLFTVLEAEKRNFEQSEK